MSILPCLGPNWGPSDRSRTQESVIDHVCCTYLDVIVPVFLSFLFSPDSETSLPFPLLPNRYQVEGDPVLFHFVRTDSTCLNATESVLQDPTQRFRPPTQSEETSAVSRSTLSKGRSGDELQERSGFETLPLETFQGPSSHTVEEVYIELKGLRFEVTRERGRDPTSHDPRPSIIHPDSHGPL